MSYLEWKLNQELNGRSTFEKDEKFREEIETYDNLTVSGSNF